MSAPRGKRAPRGSAGRTRTRRALVAAALIGLVAALLLGGASHAAYAPPPPTPQSDSAVPGVNVVMLGATPNEPGAPGANETWGIGQTGAGEADNLLVRYADGQGWSLGGSLPAGFALSSDDPRLAGRFTSQGAGVLAGAIGKRKVVLVRSAGGAFQIAPIPGEAEAGAEASKEEPLLGKGEEAFGDHRAALLAPLDEVGGGAGALLAPVQKESGVEQQVLHWDGKRWTSEPIRIPAPSASSFRVLALDATSPENAWLLGQLASGGPYPTGAVALFRRIEEGGTHVWKPVQLEAGNGDGEAHPLVVPLGGGGTVPFTVPGAGSNPTVHQQLLTVTKEGVWIDGERTDTSGAEAALTMFFRAEGEAGGQLQASWCLGPPATPSACTNSLPQVLPLGAPLRSVAWAGGGPFGERVIAGLPGGVSLRLDATSFSEVLSLGGGSISVRNPGGALGAAFSNPDEGWLGSVVPVHMTSAPAASQLRPWPVPFRRNLQAIAAQPGVPVAALGSEVLAVGQLGAVARYKPSLGWVPESLFGPGERIETPNLRAIAWPTPMRAYAVGDGGQMWLWRGETELWERDPATPIDFRANLLGVAFDPSNPARGYAVGTADVSGGGVLLRFGKTWTEETVPAAAQGASLLGIAFAGSEALVPFVHVVRTKAGVGYVSGMLANSGSGWHVDEQATQLMQAEGAQPAAVAGLPDGGAAFTTQRGSGGPRVYERQGLGAAWQATAAPLPGNRADGLALFREGGALRAMVTGGGAINAGQIAELAPSPGTPGSLIGPLEPAASGPEAGALLRQTAAGWSDQRHEVEIPAEPLGGYSFWDQQYTPDPVAAMLIDPSGSYGWTVGGRIGGSGAEREEVLETADVERYGEDATTPTGFHPTPVPTTGWATFAIGGHAECAAPCSERSLARVGPQVWLGAAVQLASRTGARAFVYTGPSVSEARVGAHRERPVPFADEFARSAQLLSGGEHLTPYVVPSPPDLDARPEREGTEQTWLSGFEEFAQKPLIAANGQPPSCASTVGCAGGYYAFETAGAAGGARVRVIVLDETAPEVGEEQLQWLEGELEAAHAAHEPAIAVGSSDLEAQINAGRHQSAMLAKVLVTGHRAAQSGLCAQLERQHAPDSTRCDAASAYFYDSPEVDEQRPLHSGTESIPSFGSGTLGYVRAAEEVRSNFHGASGILLAQVNTAARSPATNRAEVEAPLIPVIGELALEAKQGTLLRRSEPALFAGLARRPRAGCDSQAGVNECLVDPYIPIPEICTGECGTAMLPEYGFKSSQPDVGGFVEPNLGAASASTPLLGPDGKPIPESEAGSGAKSGLFCAYNPGTTIVTIVAGGYEASLPVTVQRGSVREPCGTVKLKNPPAVEEPALAAPPAPPPPVAPASAPPAGAAPLTLPAPAPPTVVAPAPAPAPHIAVLPFVAPTAIASPLLPFVPPPVPTPARPSPPSGTSAVTSPVEAVEKEEEQEEATESVSNQAVAYRSAEDEPTALYILGVVVLAAFAGASVRRSRRGRRGVQIAPAELSAGHSQRRLGDLTRRRRW